MFQRTEYTSPWRTEDVQQLGDLARDIFLKEAVPNHEKWDKQKHVDREFWNTCGSVGMLLPSIPEEYGGGGGTFAHEAVVQEEQAKVDNDSFGFSVHSGIVAHYILAYGNEEQKKRWLPKMATGELVGAIAMTEPGTGSDLQAIRTSARLDGDEYVVNGAKTFITNGGQCDLIVIVCRTNDQPGGAGLSLLVAEVTDLPGFNRGRVLDKIGMPGQDTAELFFEDMRVPKENLLGDTEGMAFMQLMAQLPQERLIIAVAAVAGMERAVELTVKYTKERTAFGRELLKFQNTRFELAECTTETYALRTFVDHCVALHIEGRLDPATASMAKYLATDKLCEVVDRCLQLFGGYGYMKEYPIARSYATARVQRIYGGTNEIMKELIARSL
ncbi:acyl-CoA dehydrogenase family protein [Corynebacterium sp. TAE3-ERU12]|uniref:acyl-CoA dehydrogenase family protein n=1 Tax=Corynebacterium sp. TAE3-ERU12 TaxID=2849491 RepID=UPI001C44CF75|nr:acyl-CoA dehydrogenase family protein [Corynebacterium sp. TAE3-ERU12]MBV7295681.1 acyl-CoA dehydrogenase family protein [Corynebacterium sp. TAE3-ERU12]